MNKITLMLMILTLISQLFGFGREIVLSYFYGASNTTDVYLISLTIPLVIFSFIGTSISTAYIPMFSKILNKYGEQVGNKYTNNLVNILIMLSTFIIVIVFFFTKQIVIIFASGFSRETLPLAVSFTRISVLGIFFTAIISVFNGFLQTKGDYLTPVLVGLPMNILIIFSIFLSKYISIYILSIGSVIATASQLLIILPAMRKKGYTYKCIIDIGDKHIKEMLYTIWPVIIGVSINQINLIIDRTIATRIIPGGLSALNYASRLTGFIQSLFVLSITTVMYPIISRLFDKSDINGFKGKITEAIGQINLLIIPITVGGIVFAEPIIRFLFARGAFDRNSIIMTTQALMFYFIGIIGVGLRDVFARAFYSMQDTKTPMKNASIALILNIVLNVLLSKVMGISGVALANSISAIFCTLLLGVSLRKRIGSIGGVNIFISFFKVVCASFVMAFISKIFYNILIKFQNNTIALMISIGIGIIIYSLLVYIMKVEEVKTIASAIRKKLGFRVNLTSENSN
ncbi:murein biosynthesis integral membrane protein MurJ [Clostridium sp.]|uniref:murein biosynthesis integral membrane protein MurJ n=1 Tax=Clostridium sp. TaxID=1506 RepID=UPI002FCC50BF